jgi:hypothetical protein
VRLELTTYRLTAGRATDCAIQELVKTKMQSVGIEPTLLRTCALSMRLNHSAKTAGGKDQHPRIAQLVERETVAACN